MKHWKHSRSKNEMKDLAQRTTQFWWFKVFPNKLNCDRRIILNSCRFYLFQSERLRLCPLPPVWNVWSKIVIDCYRSPAHPVCRRQSAAQQGVPWVTRGGGSPLSDVLCHYHHLLQLWRLFIWRGNFEISNFNQITIQQMFMVYCY